MTSKEKKVIKIKIQLYRDREKMVSALAGNGYHVWVEEIMTGNIYEDKDYFVCFEL